jgi:hypothetical protein
VALKAVIKEKENRLLTKKFEFEQNRGRSFEKPDDPIKTILTEREEDNASTLLASSRYSLRPEVVEPSVYWWRVKTKWPETHRSLEWSGRQHMVSSKTIELMHDMASVLKVFII